MTFDLGEFSDGADPHVPSFMPGSTAGSKTPSLTITSGAGALSLGLWSGAQAPPATNGFVKPDKTKSGQSRTIDLKITPSDDGTAGTVVHGTLYVDVLAFNEAQFGVFTGSDVIGIPYEYKIG